MRKTLQILSLFAIITGFSLSAYSQQPDAILQFYGGYSQPLGDFNGTFGSTLDKFTGGGNPDSNSYFMKTGINYGISLKTFMGKKKNFFVSGELSFNLFHQNTDYNLNSDPENMKLKINVTSLYFGAGWAFSPRKGINPYATLGLLASYFSGTFDDILVLQATDTQYLLRGTFRLGFQAGAGVDIPVQYSVGLTFGAKYSFTNLIGRSYEQDDKQNYSLNDKEHTINNALYPSRNITFLQIYGGVSFYFGR